MRLHTCKTKNLSVLYHNFCFREDWKPVLTINSIGRTCFHFAQLANIRLRLYYGKLLANSSLPTGSVADPGCLSRIRNVSIPGPGSEFFPSRLKVRIKEFKKSRIRILIFLPIPDPGFKQATKPGSGSATLPTGSGYNVGIGFFHFTSQDFSYRSYLYQMATAGC